MKRFIAAAAIATFGFVGAASAADMPTKAPAVAPVPVLYSWNGFYIGGSVGARWADVSWQTVAVTGITNGVPGPVGPNNPASLDSTSVRLGAYAGYNWQFAPAWIAGLEADIAWGNSSKSVSPFPGTPGFGASPTNTDTVRLGWDGSVRGRLGFLVMPTWLVYGTGGLAFQKIKTTSECGLGGGFCAGGFNATGTSSKVKSGWTVGGGVETALWNRWLARVEYRYADFGTVSNDLPPAQNTGIHSEISVRTHTALAGLAYKF